MIDRIRAYLTLERIQVWIPVIVVVLTAILSGYLLPNVTQKIQDQRKALEIKTSLVEAINQEVMEILLATQLAERESIEQNAFTESYKRWEVQRTIIAGKLRAYYPNANAPVSFERLSEGLTDIYALTGIRNAEWRKSHIEQMKQYFGNTATDWGRLEDLEFRSTNFLDWFAEWWNVREVAIAKKDAVIQEVLLEPLSLGS